MKIEQYLSPSKQHELDELTADLDSFMLDSFKEKPQPSVTWDDIQLNDEDDSRPTEPKAKRTKKPKPTPAKIAPPKFLSVKSETRTTDPYGETARLNEALDAYQERLANNVKDAELYHPINIEPFSFAKIEAVIDWLDLRFTVDPTMCKFYRKPDARSHIKKFITEQTGTRHYIAFDDSHIDQDDASFTIRLHDIRNKRNLKKITDLLIKQYGSKYESMTIDAIELSLDFYCNNGSAMVIKLHKAMQYPVDAKLLRTYKTKWTQQDIPTAPHTLHDLIETGFNIGMGDHRSDAFCVRAYFKRTDKGGQPLPIDEHRARIEVTLQKSAFLNDKIDLHLDKLSAIITCGFKKMQFTKLSKRATGMEKDTYYTQVKPFGKEQADIVSISRHKRSLPDAIESHAWLNKAKRTAVKALVKRF